MEILQARAAMKIALLFVAFFAHTADAGLSKYCDLVVTDESPRTVARPDGIRVTYLGVNGYQLEAGKHALLIDPYFTRVSLWSVAANRPLQTNLERVSAGLHHTEPEADATLVTHAHFDHLLDVPEVMRRTGAQLVSGPTAVNLAQAFGVSAKQCSVVKPGDRKRIGPWNISVVAAQHDRLFGSKPPFPGSAPSPATPPSRPSDWKSGEPLAFVIEANGQRIYLDSGGIPDAPMPRTGRIDLAILGVALPDSRRRFAAAIRNLRPRYVLPSHQDDFFSPFERGFIFGKMTNFPALRRICEREQLPGRLILLDYFRPWTLR